MKEYQKKLKKNILNKIEDIKNIELNALSFFILYCDRYIKTKTRTSGGKSILTFVV